MRRNFPCFYIKCSWEGSAFDYRVCSIENWHSIMLWVRRLSQDHIAVCRFANVKCINPGCNQTFLKEEQEQHEVICQFKLFSCQWCKKEIQLNTKQVWYEKFYSTEAQVLVSCITACFFMFIKPRTSAWYFFDNQKSKHTFDLSTISKVD